MRACFCVSPCLHQAVSAWFGEIRMWGHHTHPLTDVNRCVAHVSLNILRVIIRLPYLGEVVLCRLFPLSAEKLWAAREKLITYRLEQQREKIACSAAPTQGIAHMFVQCACNCPQADSAKLLIIRLKITKSSDNQRQSSARNPRLALQLKFSFLCPYFSSSFLALYLF